MQSLSLPLRALAAAATLALGAAPAAAGDAAFFNGMAGQWQGPGEIVAGKYAGTRFTCALNGTPSAAPGMTLDGRCRVGLFSQRVTASVERAGKTYRGVFLDGAEGKGLDVVSGNVSGDRVTVAMQREQLKGAMVARLKPDGRMGVTVSVRIGEELVPVIGLDLARTDPVATGSVR